MMRLPFGDNPITAAEDDLLGRERLAHVLAAEISSLDAQDGAVVAITGPWGSGKTSLMNLTAARLRKDRAVLGVVEFNPWLFSGAEQLAENLLTELATQLRDQESHKAKAQRIATKATGTLLKYSRGLSGLRAVPVVGPVAEIADKSLEGAHTLLSGDQSLQRRRQDAIKALAALTRRVVVLVDDIDRLTRTETRDLFRTVRLSASFPNVVYVLCLDHQVVAGALNEDGFSGKAYLEKILTVTCRVPDLADHQVGQMFVDGLNAILERHVTGPDDDDMWAQAYPELIRPLFTTIRDAKRVLASLPITLRLIGDELPVVDVVVLECLRTLYPDLHAAIDIHAIALTQPRTYGSPAPEGEVLSSSIAEFVKSDKRFGGRLATDLIRTLFPHAVVRLPNPGGWLGYAAPAMGSVGERTGLIFYLTHELPPGVATAGSVRAIVTAFGNEKALRAAFDAVPDDRLEDALNRIVQPAESMDPESVPVSVRVLLELFPRLRTGRGTHDSSEVTYAITRPLFKMLTRLQQPAVEDLAAELVTTTPTIYAAFELLTTVGHGENARHRLVREEHARELEVRLRERLAAAGEDLAQERNLMTMLLHTFPPHDGEPVLPELMLLPVAATMLKTSVTAVQSATIGAGPTRTRESFLLHWEILSTLYGTEDNVAVVVDNLIGAGHTGPDADLQRALDLARGYLAGWRPSDPFNDSEDQE